MYHVKCISLLIFNQQIFITIFYQYTYYKRSRIQIVAQIILLLQLVFKLKASELKHWIIIIMFCVREHFPNCNVRWDTHLPAAANVPRRKSETPTHLLILALSSNIGNRDRLSAYKRLTYNTTKAAFKFQGITLAS